MILGHPTLHKAKAVIALYLLQLQFEADDKSVGEMHGDQRTARESYLVSITPLAEQTKKHGLDEPSQVEKRARAGPVTMIPKVLIIYIGGTLTASTGDRG